jgi:hypothetical protein
MLWASTPAGGAWRRTRPTLLETADAFFDGAGGLPRASTVLAINGV